jgi:hypothetical protein
MLGVSTADGITPVPLEVDPVSGLLQVSSSGGSGGTQYTDGGTPPTHPIGTMPIFNNSGTWSEVSASAGLPVNIVAGGGTGGGPSDAAASAAASESDTARQKVTSVLRLYDTSQTAGSQLVTAKGDQTNGLWVNVKAGSVTANAGTNLNTSLLALESGGNLATIATNTTSLATSANQTNGNQIVKIKDSLGNTLSQLATGDAVNPSGNLSVGGYPLVYNGTNGDRIRSATQANNTTGTGLQGVGLLGFDGTNYQRLSVNSTTYTSKFGLDGNLLGTLGTAFSTAGKVDIKGADGDVFVRQATAANLNATVVGTGTFAVQATPVTQADTFMLGGVNVKEINGVAPLMGNGTTGTGSQRVTIASDNTAFSVNAVQSTAAAITAGWPTIAGETADTTGTFTNATQTTSVTASSLSGYQAATVSINGTYGTATAVFEGSDDGGTTWYSLQAGRTDSAVIETGYTSLTNTTRMWTLEITGLDSFRVRSTAVASGTVNVRISISAAPTADAAVISIGSALPAGTNLLGKVGIDQTTLGTTNNVSISGTTGAGTSTLLKDDTSFGDAVTTGILSVTNRLWNGTNYDRAYGDKTNGAFVNIKASAFAAATNAAPPANAVQVGGIAATALPSAFTATDLAPILLDKFGRIVTSPFTVRDLLGDQTTSITSTTAATTIVTADASNMLDLISLTLTNTSATATEVSLYNDDGTTLRWTGYVPAGDMRGIVFPAPLKQTAVNKTWKMITVTSVASLKVTAQFVKNQ